jgi:tRNA pseudouridine32 synthase/23S rRNA pseudouridine746 synthase
MLEGIPLEDNPFLLPSEEGLSPEIIYEDEYLLIVYKPHGLRSVPGVDIFDSVYSRLKTKMGDVEPLYWFTASIWEPGLLVVANTPDIISIYRSSFSTRTVKNATLHYFQK